VKLTELAHCRVTASGMSTAERFSSNVGADTDLRGGPYNSVEQPRECAVDGQSRRTVNRNELVIEAENKECEGHDAVYRHHDQLLADHT
jgi:hypothetical protein